jgi:hypothetical protein
VEEVAQTPEDFMAILKRGESSRSYASTEMNNESSRSHTIYRVTIESIDCPEDGSPPTGGGKVAYLNLVDLAGSERQKSTKAEGKTLKEGSNINKSLLALGAVINKLGESSKKVQSHTCCIIWRRFPKKSMRITTNSLFTGIYSSLSCPVSAATQGREAGVHPVPGLQAHAHPQAVAGRQHAHQHALRRHARAHAPVRARTPSSVGGSGYMIAPNVLMLFAGIHLSVVHLMHLRRLYFDDCPVLCTERRR